MERREGKEKKERKMFVTKPVGVQKEKKKKKKSKSFLVNVTYHVGVVSVHPQQTAYA